MSFPERAQRFLQDRWLSVDARSLGLFRIGFGLLLLGNLFDRLSDDGFIAFYTNEGVLTNHQSLARPFAPDVWSPLFGFSTPGESGFAISVIALIYVLYLVGYQTWLMKWLALIGLLSLQNRALLMQNGGHVVTHIVAVWSAFLPLGARFSVDSLSKSYRFRRADVAEEVTKRPWQRGVPLQHRTLAFFFICANFAVIYFFNALHKKGHTWSDGSAVHWLLWQNRIATELATFVRMHEPRFMSPMLTWGTLVIEWALVLLILSPVLQKWTRALAVLCVFSLHGGISLMVSLGPFSYAMMSFSLLLPVAANWEWLCAKLATPAKRRTVLFDSRSPYQRQLVRLLARLDGLNALTFQKADGALRTMTESGPPATAAIIRALPFGILWAHALRPLLNAAPKRQARLTALFGLDRPEHDADGAPTEAVQRLHHARFVIGQVLVSAVAFAVTTQILMENWGVHPALKPRDRPAWATGIINYLQIPQGWSMFAPDAPAGDMRLIVDATLADGSHLDPLTGAAPDFEAPFHGPWGMDANWCEWHGRSRHHPPLWPAFRAYVMALPARRGWPPERGIVRFDVHELTYDSPPPGQNTPRNIRTRLLFRSDQL